MENEQGPSEFDDQQMIERLRAFGTAPLPDEIATAAAARLRRPERRAPGGHAKWVVAAAVAGFMAGSVGLAAADVLPAPVQDVAHHALDAVGVHVPPGHQRFNDPATCPGGPYANHGAYVRAHHDDPNAGESPCGKPLKAVTPGHESDTNEQEPGGHGHGKGKGQHNQHPDKSSHSGKGEGNGNGHGHGQGNGGKPEDKADTHDDDEPAVGATPSTSMPASTTTSTTTTTNAPATTTTLPSTPTT